jgi:hypothetical protein
VSISLCLSFFPLSGLWPITWRFTLARMPASPHACIAYTKTRLKKCNVLPQPRPAADYNDALPPLSSSSYHPLIPTSSSPSPLTSHLLSTHGCYVCIGHRSENRGHSCLLTRRSTLNSFCITSNHIPSHPIPYHTIPSRPVPCNYKHRRRLAQTASPWPGSRACQARNLSPSVCSLPSLK